MGHRSHKNNRRNIGTRRVKRRTHNKHNGPKLESGHFKDVEASKIWDFKRKTAENYAALGLIGDTNSSAEVEAYRNVRVAGGAEEAAETLPTVDLKSLLHNESRPANWMKDTEIEYLQVLVAKHGNNWKAMEKDMKRNNLQHSATHLETRIARMTAFLKEKKAAT